MDRRSQLNRNAALHCGRCGAELAERLYAMRRGACCCENCFLEEKDAYAELNLRDDLYSAFAEALVQALDLREHETGLHSKRVACHTLVLGRRLVAERDALRQLYWGALLHDIGKIGVPDAVLLKQGPLAEAEWREMRTHPEKGYALISRLPAMAGSAQIVLAHEERYDGTGYPRGLRGGAIPLGARIFAVIDTLDAMSSDRPYRKALSFDIAKREILRLSGTQFDPEAVRAFVAEEEALREMVGLKCETPQASGSPHQEDPAHGA